MMILKSISLQMHLKSAVASELVELRVDLRAGRARADRGAQDVLCNDCGRAMGQIHRY